MSLSIGSTRPAVQGPGFEPDLTPVSAPPPPPPAAPTAEPAQDAFGDSTQAARGRDFSAFCTGAAPAASAQAPEGEVRARISQGLDRALAELPGLSAEQRVATRDAILGSVDNIARTVGLPLSAIRKLEVSVNVNGSVINAGVSRTVYPESEAGAWAVSAGVGTPSVPGVGVSVSVGFNTGSPLLGNGDGAAINGRVTFPGPMGNITVKGGTDGGISVEQELVGIGGGRLPSAGLEVNVPVSDAAAAAQAAVERMTGTDRGSLDRQAIAITSQALEQSQAELRARFAAINRRYDAEIRSDPSRAPGANRARSIDLSAAQQAQTQREAAILESERQMRAAIARRFGPPPR